MGKLALVICTLFGSVLASVAHASSTTTYTYDALGRLTATSTTGTVANGAQMSIGYDAAGNRTIYVVTGSVSQAIVVPLNGLQIILLPAN
ncbi:RHS repeat protein [Novosphingobium sp. H3SJ31-1]|uniref:RHS repeat protein n=1 Tax=Novosphingobium album (ex Liu et al. 2023) TaxID=3031130 RepID=A0ABT5WKE3_9SPHN|nr:RHS repeat protein [Novosphingobium album (ex Liu et al. 2023)]